MKANKVYTSGNLAGTKVSIIPVNFFITHTEIEIIIERQLYLNKIESYLDCYQKITKRFVISELKSELQANAKNYFNYTFWDENNTISQESIDIAKKLFPDFY